MGMGPGIRQFDLLATIGANVLNVFKKKHSSGTGTGPCDGNVFKLHYRVTFCLLIGGYSAILFSWWNKDILTCTSKYNADSQIRADYINICASYLYVPDEEAVIPGRQYLLYYRWIHYILFLLAFIVYFPHKIAKRAENMKLKKLFDHVESTKEENGSKDVINYYFINSGTHNNLFTKYMMVHFVALFVNVFAFFTIDFAFLGKFSDLGYATYPFTRDIKNFTDELSLRFPPFAQCEITPFNALTNKRTERYGCHLTYMELYEKYFIVLWFWMTALTIVTILYIMYLSLFFIPSARLFLLTYLKPLKAKQEDIERINNSLRTINVGDFYFLYRLKSHFSVVVFYDILNTIYGKGAPEDFMSHKAVVKHPSEGPKPRMRGHMNKNMQSQMMHRQPKAVYID